MQLKVPDADAHAPLPEVHSWSSMIREVPSPGYGDIRFDAQPPGVARERSVHPPSPLDQEAAAELEKNLPL